MGDINKAFKLTPGLWKKIAVHAMAGIRKDSQAGISRTGKPFPAYAKSYAELKSSGFKSPITGKKMAFRGISLERQVRPPNFRLTRRTMQSLNILAMTKDAAIIGWRNEEANKVARQEERKKYKTGGITPDRHKEIINLVDQHLVGRWNKLPNIKVDL